MLSCQYRIYYYKDKRDLFNPSHTAKVYGANMGPTWNLSAPDGPHVGPMNLAIRVIMGIPTSRKKVFILKQAPEAHNFVPCQ